MKIQSLLLSLGMAFCAFPPSAVGQDSSILELATASEDLTDLVFALNATGLTDALDAEGPFTVFAPLNGAFADSEIFFYLEPAWILHLASTLFYHVVDGASPLDSLEVGDELPTLFGSSLTVASLQPYIIEDVEVEDTVEATNGIVNLIEEVLLPPFSQTNIPTIAALSNDFSILVSLLERADLVDVLAEGAYTVFAPTNAAFEKIPPENVEYLISEEGLEDLTDILLTHVVEGIAYGEFVMAGDMVTAVNGVNLTVTSVDPLTITAAGDSLIVAPDVLASNGVIHVIDTVLLPPAPETLAPTSVSSSEATPVDTVIDTTMGPTPAVTVDETTMGPTAGPLGGENTIVDIAVATPAFETLVALVTVADLVGALSGEGPFTLFAPINNAFRNLPEGQQEFLTSEEGLPLLVDILQYHVVSGTYTSDMIEDGMMLTTLQGDAVTLSITGDGPMVNTANILETDVSASNGVIHVIDAVLIPPEEEEEEEETTGTETVTPTDSVATSPVEEIGSVVPDSIMPTNETMTEPPSVESSPDDGVLPEEEEEETPDTPDTPETPQTPDAATTSGSFSSVTISTISTIVSMVALLSALA